MQRFKTFFFADKMARWTSRVLLLLFWQLGGNLSVRVPTPLGTLQFIGQEWSRAYEGAPWGVFNNELSVNLIVTLARAGVALTLVVLVALVVGYAMGQIWRIQASFTDLVVVGIALPAFIWALLAVMWFGFGNIAPVFVGFVAGTPMLTVNVFQGSRAIPRELRDMSESYNVTFRHRFRHLVLPSMAGFVMAGFRVAALATWGAVTLVEWFGNNQGAGHRAHYWYDTSNFDGLMGWGLIILAVVITLDRAVLEPLVRKARRWRGDITGLGSAREGKRTVETSDLELLERDGG